MVPRNFRQTGTALAAALALTATPFAQPLAAQERQDTPSLEDLIPDSAVDNPEEWAAQGVPAADEADADAQVPLEADAPLAEMPMITVPWPEEIDLPQLAPLENEDDIDFVQFEDEIPRMTTGSEERLSEELVLVFPTDTALFPERDEFLDRFESLSTIESFEDDGNIARLAVQAREDEALLGQLLRVYGYFDSQLTRTVGGIESTVESDLEPPAVRFDIIPGPQYTVGAIDLGNLRASGDQYESLRRAYDIEVGDPLLLDVIEAEQFNLDKALGESGFPFATIEAPSVLVDHDRDEGDITMLVEPGGRYRLGQVISSDPEFLSSRHLTRIARWDEGDIYRRSDELDLRRAMLATGLLGSVELTPVVVQQPTETEPGVVDIQADLTQAPLRTLAGSIGFGTEEGIRLEGSWEHRNLFPPEGMLRVRGIAGTQEQLLGVTFQKNNFYGRDRIFAVDAFATTIDTDAYDAETVSLVARYERLSTLLFQKPFSWGTGFELVYTNEAETKVKGQKSADIEYLIGALPSFVQFDTSDSLLDPTEGFRIRASVSPEISRVFESNSTYLKTQFDLATYQGVSDGVVLAARARVGSIIGADLAAIAPSRRLYAGGGGSVRGYGYQSIGPTNALGTPNGGRSLVEASVEARIDTGFMDGAVSVVPFVDAGTVSRSITPTFDDIRFGAGVGVRYETGFGPLRVDVAVPLNKREEDSWVAVYVGLGQAF
ncbi:autotransporter assembly complex protein TamA [Aurantiacibacter odishensis]|uniref:autotransporter assembly complex protein TamA n=1 Tax=Aurantiacibacter odishensis TaxID=1155476 RepID=UPI000E743B52|nr:BamA/TamA family outer membrane protein [Aurantiacibacter odishensis]